MFGIVCRYANIVDILCALVGLDNTVQVFSHETGEGQQGSTESLCQSSVSECSAGNVEGQHFNGHLVRHLKEVIRLRTVYEKAFSRPCVARRPSGF